MRFSISEDIYINIHSTTSWTLIISNYEFHMEEYISSSELIDTIDEMTSYVITYTEITQIINYYNIFHAL